MGQLGIQLAKLRGISFVATTCSPRTREYVDTLGADLVIDYTTDKWDDLEKFPQLKSLTGVFDCVGKPEFSTWNLANESGVLAEDGNYVAISFDQTVGRDYKGKYAYFLKVDLCRLGQLQFSHRVKITKRVCITELESMKN